MYLRVAAEFWQLQGLELAPHDLDFGRRQSLSVSNIYENSTLISVSKPAAPWPDANLPHAAIYDSQRPNPYQTWQHISKTKEIEP